MDRAAIGTLCRRDELCPADGSAWPNPIDVTQGASALAKRAAMLGAWRVLEGVARATAAAGLGALTPYCR